jgi:hypothetical protein
MLHGEGQPLGCEHEGLLSSILRGFEPAGVHVVQLWMGGPLRKYLIVGAVLGVALFQCD